MRNFCFALAFFCFSGLTFAASREALLRGLLRMTKTTFERAPRGTTSQRVFLNETGRELPYAIKLLHRGQTGKIGEHNGLQWLHKRIVRLRASERSFYNPQKNCDVPALHITSLRGAKYWAELLLQTNPPEDLKFAFVKFIDEYAMPEGQSTLDQAKPPVTDLGRGHLWGARPLIRVFGAGEKEEKAAVTQIEMVNPEGHQNEWFPIEDLLKTQEIGVH